MKRSTSLALFALLALSFYAFAEKNPTITRLTWWGHAAFQLETPQGKTLWIDPWLSNPMNPKKDKAMDLVKSGDFILITHGHFDHVGEAVQIAKKTKARLVAPFELGNALAKVHGFPADQMGFDTLGNPGGELTLADGALKVIFTNAIHGSGLDHPGDKSKTEPAVYGGTPVGYVIKIQNGPTLYDSGDTAYFSDMKWIGKRYKPDVAILNIGGHFGMEVPDALQAAKDLDADLTIPQHYATFPILTQEAKGFTNGLKKARLKFKAPKPGETLIFQGSHLQ